MNRTTLKKKAAILAALGIFSFSGSFALYAPPQAEAGLLDFGDVITNGIQIAQARNTIQKYIKALDTTPEGQQHTLETLQSYTGVYDDPQLMEQLGNIMSNMTSAIGQVDESVYDLRLLRDAIGVFQCSLRHEPCHDGQPRHVCLHAQ